MIYAYAYVDMVSDHLAHVGWPTLVTSWLVCESLNPGHDSM